MSHDNTLDRYILDLIPSDLGDAKILDVGSGFGYWGFYIRVQKEGNSVCSFLVGLDIWKPYIEREKMRIYDELIISIMG